MCVFYLSVLVFREALAHTRINYSQDKHQFIFS